MFIEILDQTLLSKMFLNSSHALFYVLLKRISTPKLHHQKQLAFYNLRVFESPSFRKETVSGLSLV